MEQTLNSTNEQTDSVLSRAKQNFVPSSKQLVKDTIEMITNPVQTAKSLYELGSGIVQLAIPGEQGNEDTARAVGQHFADRYGSIEKAKETFATDPAAFALDALGVITGGAAIGVGVAKAGAKAVSKVGRKVDVDDGVADAQLQAAKAAKAKEPDRSGMGDLGDGIQPSVYDEALEVSDKYGNNSIFKDGEFDADEYLTYMDDTKELRNSSTIPNDYGLSAKEFLETLSVYSNKNIIKYEGASYESPGFLSELKSMSNKNPWYHIKENGDVVLHADRSLERPVLGKPKRKKTLKISGGKKQTTKEEILEFLDIDPKVLKNSLDEIPDKTGEYKEILFDMNKLKEQGIARAERLADDGPQPRGTTTSNDLWSSPNQKISSADTSINSSKLPQGYNTLKKENVFKEGDVVLDIGGGKFDNAVKDLSKSNVEVKIYDPFNRSPEHNKSVVDKVKDGQVDKVVSFNTLNVIPEEINRLKVVKQAHNALKDKGQAFFTVYEKKGLAGNTNKGYQTSMSTKEYIPLIESVFGEGSVTLKNKVIRAEKKGGTIMGLAAGGIATPGIAKGDGLKDPSILSPKDAKTKAAAADIKKKISGVAKKPQQGNTNIQTAMLLEPEKLLKKYEKPITPPPNVLAANEGAMPVVEEDTQEQSTRQQRRSEIINQLDGAGLSVPAIKAIVGNIDVETGGTFSHTQKQEGGNGYGLFQLDFQKPFYDKYLESQNLEDSISSQVNYFLDEINKGGTIGPGNAKSIMDVFNDPKTTPKEATIVLVDKFFKPGKPHLERRIASAMQGYDEELEGFKEGGLADNTDDTPGATESEVADDIPAMISEGELVVPANVVRYHGLSKYENMRKTALNALDELEDNGQIRPVDSNGTPVVKDVKEQTDEIMASKGATVARYNEGGSPKITTGGPRVTATPARRESTIKYDEQTGTGEYNYTEEGINTWFDDNLMFNTQAIGSPNSGRRYNSETNMIEEYSYKNATPGTEKITGTFKPEDYFALERIQKETSYGGYDQPEKTLNDYFSQDLEPVTKGTLTTPEGKDYRVTNPNTKITATGPRTTNIVGGNYTGVDLPGFGTDKKTEGVVDKKGTVDTVIDELTPFVKAGVTIGALDLLFNQGKITANALGWAKDNIFSGEIFNPERWSLFKDGKLKLSYDSVAKGTAATSGTAAEAFKAGKSISSQIQKISDTSYIFNGTEYATNAEAYAAAEELKASLSPSEIKPNISLEDAQAIQATTGTGDPLTYTRADGTTGIISGDGIFSWKGALSTLGTAISIYDIIENGPTAANVTGALAGGAGMVTANVFGAGTALANANPAMYELIGKFAGPLMWAALAFAAYETFKGPPSGKVGEAAYNFDNPEYNSEDVMSGGFWTRKRSDDNITAALELTQSIGSYVHSMEEALGIDLGGELFVDVGNTNGLRYGWVDGYDQQELKRGYHKTDLDYKLLAGTGQVGKGYIGEDALSNFMEDIQDDTNVVVMFALADKASGGKGYATFDNVNLYRQKIQTLKTYKSGMAGSGTQAVLTDQERNLLEGFQKKEFAAVTGDELAALLPIYDKIAPVQKNNSFNFNSLVI